MAVISRQALESHGTARVGEAGIPKARKRRGRRRRVEEGHGEL